MRRILNCCCGSRDDGADWVVGSSVVKVINGTFQERSVHVDWSLCSGIAFSRAKTIRNRRNQSCAILFARKV